VSDSARFLFATLCGLVLAGIVHLSAVLAMPWLSERDAFSRLKPTLTADKSELVSAPAARDTWLPHPDPAAAVSACAYNLDEGPVRISANTGPLFQSLSFHAKGGGAFFAITDRAAVRGVLEVVVMTRVQLDQALAEEDEDEPSTDVRIIAPQREGLVVVRVLAAFPSLREAAEQAAKSVSCTIDQPPASQ
jgi:uncharacterized membrane protein